MGSLADFRRELASHHLALLDTMIFSYHLSEHPRYLPLTQALLGLVESGQLQGLMTAITLAEILTVPAQAGAVHILRDYEIYLTHFPNLTLVPLDAALARQTALARAATGLRLPDAVQIAAAQLHNADVIVTNDLRWQAKVTDKTLLILDDYVA